MKAYCNTPTTDNAPKIFILVYIYLSRNYSGITCKELCGLYFGNVSGTTITLAYNRVEKEITQKKRVKSKLNKIKK